MKLNVIRTSLLCVLALVVVEAATVAVAAPSAARYVLAVSASGGGTITSSPHGISCPSACHASFSSGTAVRLVERPKADWRFTSWSGSCSGEGSCSVKLTAARSVKAVFGRTPTPTPPPTTTTTAAPSGGPFTLTSPAFASGDPLPTQFTCNASAIPKSPPLSWSGAPAGTMSFALVLEDPDAVPQPNTTFTHWLTWDIASTATGLAENQSGPVLGKNDGGGQGYTPPCPPTGTGVHHYHFRLLALSVSSLSLAAGSTIGQFTSATSSVVLGEADLIATVAS